MTGADCVLVALRIKATPDEHAARHGFPDMITRQRVADWWRRSLSSLAP